MKKILITVSIAPVLMACEIPAEKELNCSNKQIVVEQLFSVDSMVVYRFMDAGNYHYVASKGQCISIE